MGTPAPVGLLWCVLGALQPHRAAAEATPPDISHELKLFESTEATLDPLGLDPAVGSQLDEAAARLTKPAAPPPPLRQGVTLTAIHPVTERAHQLALRWEAGLMHGSARIELGSDSPLAASIAYRYPLPEGARLSALSISGPSAGWVDAARIHDARGEALAIEAGPVAKGTPLVLTLEYVAPAPIHGGELHFTLPARGEDPGLAPLELTLTTPPALRLTTERGGAVDDRLPLPLRGMLEAPLHTEQKATCGARSCTRSYTASPHRAAATRPTWLWLDASPSMEGRARNRTDRMLAALLGSLPDDTLLSPTLFAAHGRSLPAQRVAAADLRALSDALLEDVGAASRLHGLVQRALPELRRTRPRLLVVSDGKLDPGDDAPRALALAAAQGADVWFVDVGGAAPELPHAVSRLSLADADTLDDVALTARVRVLVAARSGGKASGEEHVAVRAPSALRASSDGPWLRSWLAADELLPATRGTPPAQRTPTLAAPRYQSAPPPAPVAYTGMPKESVLSMLRTQLVPRARACLRSDRRGRADYAVRLTFEAEFAEREVYDTRVVGDVPRALSQCLLALLPELRVPAFTGRVRVRYPIYTEREEVPEAVELPAHVLGSVDRALGTRVAGERR
jgi:hypothetical protein